MKKIFQLSIVAAFIAPLLAGFIPAFALVFAIACLPAKSGVFGISIIQAQSLFTKTLVAVYKEEVTVKGFLTSFFTPFESMSHELSIAVERDTELVAVDVHRYSNGNHNESTLSHETIIIPPFYKEFLTANQHRLYNQVITAISKGDMSAFKELTAEMAKDLMKLRRKIQRAIELQCGQVLEDGIIQLSSAVNIDFGRKAASKVNKGAGNYWDTASIDPYKDLEDGCQFLRETGKASGSTFDAIMGQEALSLFLSNTIVKERSDIRRYNMDDIRKPENTRGASFHGEVTCGSYIVRIFTYPEVFEQTPGVFVKYMNPKKVVLLPETTNFKLGYAAVPQLIRDGQIEQKGAFLINEIFDYENTAHKIYMKSAPVAIPVAVDQIYTVQVVA